MKQFVKYFSWLFILLGVVSVVFIIVFIIHSTQKVADTRNDAAPSRRVYDYADVLTDSEEKELEMLIRESEEKIRCDLVLVTIDEPIIEQYGYTSNTDAAWNFSMMNYADDFYDNNNFGYDKIHGDGALLLDNQYLAGTSDSQAGSWLSTCGRVYKRFSSNMIDDVLDDVDRYIGYDPFMAYKAYVKSVTKKMLKDNDPFIPFPLVVIVPFIISAIFIATHLKNKEGDRTTTSNTYVEPNSIHFNVRTDELINSHITSVVISSGSSGGGGGGGGHRSSGGVSHGGGGHRR